MILLWFFVHIPLFQWPKAIKIHMLLYLDLIQIHVEPEPVTVVIRFMIFIFHMKE